MLNKLFWIFLYNLVLFPLIYLFGLIGSLFNQKLKDGFYGRRKTYGELVKYFKTVDRSRSIYWFHVASHGEYEQTRPVISGLKEVEPLCIVMVSFFSPSGYKNVSDDNIDKKIYLPFDSIFSVRRALKLVKPKKIIFAAYDIWPNLIWVAHHRGIHINIFAARFTDHTRKVLPIIRSFYRSVYSSFSSIYTITDHDYLQLQRIIPNTDDPTIRALGNPRYDQVKQKADNFTEKRTISVLLREKRLVVGSVWPQDEEIIAQPIIDILKREDKISVLWVPHEPTEEYISKSQQLFESQGISTKILRSKNGVRLNKARVGIIATVGVLYKLYWQGQLAYVGGGFSTGVHNVMEPAIARLPVIFGPKYKNFHEAVELIKQGGAVSVSNSEEMANALEKFFIDKNKFISASFAATEVIHKNLGSSTRIVRSILRD